MNHIILQGDSLQLIKSIPYESIDLLITSPPYWAKRTYSDNPHELGLEPTPLDYINTLTNYFIQFRPYLKPQSNLFINLGDTFFGSGSGAYSKYYNSDGTLNQAVVTKEKFRTTKRLQPKIKQDNALYRNKQLLLIPSRFAISMQSHGFLSSRCTLYSFVPTHS